QVSISVSLKPSPTATAELSGSPNSSRSASRALALEIPGAAMSSQPVQPIEYSTPSNPDSAMPSENSCGETSGAGTTAPTASSPISSSMSLSLASTPKLASWNPAVERNVPSDISTA